MTRRWESEVAVLPDLVELLRLEDMMYWLQIEAALVALLALSIIARRRRARREPVERLDRRLDSVLEFLTEEVEKLEPEEVAVKRLQPLPGLPPRRPAAAAKRAAPKRRPAPPPTPKRRPAPPPVPPQRAARPKRSPTLPPRPPTPAPVHHDSSNAVTSLVTLQRRDARQRFRVAKRRPMFDFAPTSVASEPMAMPVAADAPVPRRAHYFRRTASRS